MEELLCMNARSHTDRRKTTHQFHQVRSSSTFSSSLPKFELQNRSESVIASVLEGKGDEPNPGWIGASESRTRGSMTDLKTITRVAIYAINAVVTRVMPCMRAFPDRLALGSLSTELGEVFLKRIVGSQ
jgi:hypothetical protein